MSTASEVLLIIVSAVLSVFLIVLIGVGVYFYRVLKEIRRITARAENVVGSVESAAQAIGRTATPMAVFKLIGGIINHNSRRKRS